MGSMKPKIFNMKLGFWQVRIADKYRTAFTVLFEHYELCLLGPQNAPSEFSYN